MRARVKPTKTWISKSKFEIENEEELLACRRIILKIVRCYFFEFYHQSFLHSLYRNAAFQDRKRCFLTVNFRHRSVRQYKHRRTMSEIQSV